MKDLQNKIWLIANDKEAEYEFFCKVYDLNTEHSESFKMFRNQNLSTAEVANG